jgi:3-oxoacyl-[acyl-carrier protein] reductase
MTWRLWWPYASKIVQRQSSSRYGWFKRHRRGIVRRLAADGASVAFTYSSSPEKALELVREIEPAGGKALSLKADSGSAEELRAAVTRAAEAFGTLDIFVSNAGILTRGTIDTYTLEAFDRMVAINVRAAFVGIQAAAQQNERRWPDRYHR